MFRDKLFYYLANYTLQHTFEKEVVKFINNKKRLVIFDVGCYRGIFAKTILNLIGRKKHKFYLFDINKKVKKYIQNLINFNNFYYNEIALSNKNGKANYNYNNFFESAGIHAEAGDLKASASFILKALDQERRAGVIGPQVLQLIKPRA